MAPVGKKGGNEAIYMAFEYGEMEFWLDSSRCKNFSNIAERGLVSEANERL